MNKKVLLSALGVVFLVGIFIAIIFAVPTKVEMFGQEYNGNIKELDLSDISLGDDDAWMYQLSKFSKLRYVNFGNNHIYKSEKDKLLEMYPDKDFRLVAKVKIYNMEVLEDITELDLSNEKVDDTIVDLLKQLPNLIKVKFGNVKLDRQLQFKLLETYPNIEFDWQISMLGSNYSSTITSLNLSGVIINDIEELKEGIKLLPKLKSLDLANTNLTNEQMGRLREDFPNLDINWIVYFGQWHTRTDAIAFSVLIKDFSHKRLTTEDIQVLKYCTKLQALDLGHQAIDDISVIGNYMPDLRVLILADNRIKDITPIAKLKHLHYLELFMNDFTDLSPLKDLKGLVDLNISHIYKLSDITPILDLPKLERIWLTHTKVSAKDVDLLRTTYPNAIICNTGFASTGNGWRSHPRYPAMIKMFKTNTMSELFTKYD